MRLPLATLLVAALVGSAHAQQPDGPLIYSTYFGDATPAGMSVDDRGAAYVVGVTDSDGLPTTEGALQPRMEGSLCLIGAVGAPDPFQDVPCPDAFVGKLAADGTWDYLTYLGGRGWDSRADIAVDSEGSAYILAQTEHGLPATEGVYQIEPGSGNTWIGKLDAAGRLLWGTHLGSGSYLPRAIAVDGQGAVIVLVLSGESVMPVPSTGAATAKLALGEARSFLAKLNSDGTELLWVVPVADAPNDLAIASDGSIVVTGGAGPDFPVTAGAYQAAFPGPADRFSAFVARVSSDGSEVLYSTYLGGEAATSGWAVAVDAEGNALVAGTREPGDFPFTSGSVRTGSEGFLAKLDPAGGRLLFAADIGGAEPSLDLDSEGVVYLAGKRSPELDPFPAAAFPFCGPPGRFAAKISPDGARLPYATSLPAGRKAQVGAGPAGSLLLATSQSDRGFPATPSGDFRLAGRPSQGLLARIDPAHESSDPILYPSLIRNAADYGFGPVAPGEWVTIFEPPFGLAEPVSAQFEDEVEAPTELGDARVLFDGVPGRLVYAHRCQINAIAPFELSGDETIIEVEYQGQRSTAAALPVARAQPGPFGVVNSDGSINTPLATAPKASVVALFGTGAGVMDPPLANGEIPTGGLPAILDDVKILYQDPDDEQWRELEVLYAGAAPGLIAGIVQVNFRLPDEVRVPIGPAFRPDLWPPVYFRWVVGEHSSRPFGIWLTPPGPAEH